MNGEQITSRLAAHLKWLSNEFDESGQRFVEDGVDFIGGDWSNHSMSCAILFDSRFDDCDLHAVDFFQAELQGSTFNRANLQNANLSKANLDGCVFNEASMEQVSAMRLLSTDVDFVATSLVDSDLRLSTFIRGDFSRANLTGANLEGCTFDECRFCDSDLTGVKGLESVNVESKIVVGPGDSPVELMGDVATEWMRSQSRR
ncbi:pentapeptide repeat-containing protein [Schlesneria sp. DSM 10557]|uniref:pentapeptide repeat-containing protein n=1 Tax=Schlesneria sp. DSM 10557 TaxID=3044399 RepID=UPI0035A15F90